MKYEHTFNDNVQEGVHIHGVQIWRPSVPEPLWVGFGMRKAQCDCGKKFKSRQAYIEHFIYYAVWQDESGYIPSLLSPNTEKNDG